MEIGGKKYTKKTNKGKSTRKTKKHKWNSFEQCYKSL
jgi:hypothetical protein